MFNNIFNAIADEIVVCLLLIPDKFITEINNKYLALKYLNS